MALTRAQLLMGDGGQGVVLSGQAQGVRPGGNGIRILSDGVIEVDSQTIVGVMKLGQTPAAAAAAYNNYTWPTGAGLPGQQLQTNGTGILSWEDADGIDWTLKGQLLVGTGVNTDILLNAGSNLSVLIADSTTASGLNYSSAMNTAMQAPTGTTLQRPLPPDLSAGQIRFNEDTNKFEFYTGTAWEEIASGDPTVSTFVKQTIPTTGSGSAVIPAGTTAARQSIPTPLEGYTRFNSTTKYLEYFNGTRWIENSGGIPDLGLNLEVTNSLVKTKVPEAAVPTTPGIGAGQAIVGSTYYDTNLGSTFVYYSNGGTPVWVMT